MMNSSNIGKIITLDIDNKKHPVLLVNNKDDNYSVFYLSSYKNNNSILSNIINYKLTVGLNTKYNINNTINNYVRCDKVFEITNGDYSLFGYLSPNTKSTLKDLISTHYFIYTFLKNNNIITENNLSEELKTIFYSDRDMYNNKRYKYLINLLLDRNNFISFIKEVNKEYKVSLDVDSTYYQYLQFVKEAYA